MRSPQAAREDEVIRGLVGATKPPFASSPDELYTGI